MFGDVAIENSEYLYNLDNVADYIYVCFKNGGYAIYQKKTMELLECSMDGSISYPKNTIYKYYCGPRFYMYKHKNKFVDVLSNEYLNLTNEEAFSYANNIRKSLMNKRTPDFINIENKFDYIKIENNVEEDFCNDIIHDSSTGDDKPKIDRDTLIRVTDGKYIPNYRYFLLDPKHGYNSSGTCGAVATQLLLSYHNYYSDRRIIDNRFLNGNVNNCEENPNLCSDPMLMNSLTLGTRGNDEDGSDDDNSYFQYVVSKIPSGATTNQVKDGIANILTERNNEINGNIEYSLNSKIGGWFFGIGTVDSGEIISELDSGRPVLILMQKNLGGLDHYVVAYGYNNYTYPNSSESYLGYITHFGWGSDCLNVWVNSAWCHSYITLKFEHTHNYYDCGPILGSNRKEYKCEICNHRTDAAIIMSNRDRYFECVVPVSQNGYFYKDYFVIFKTSGNKLFQTFGSKDVMLFLYDENYNQLASNDDSGANLNSLFCYNVEANTVYYLRIQFYSKANEGEVKVSVTPSSIEYKLYEDILHSNGNMAFYSFDISLNKTCVLTFTPEETGAYTLKTYFIDDQPIDTYLYLIDPTSISSCLCDDDSGGNRQSLIDANLINGRRYFIVVSAYNITNTSGAARLSISKK